MCFNHCYPLIQFSPGPASWNSHHKYLRPQSVPGPRRPSLPALQSKGHVSWLGTGSGWQITHKVLVFSSVHSKEPTRPCRETRGKGSSYISLSSGGYAKPERNLFLFLLFLFLFIGHTRLCSGVTLDIAQVTI